MFSHAIAHCSSTRKCLRQIESRRNRESLRFWISTLTIIVVFAGGCSGSAGQVGHLQGEVTLKGRQIPDDANAYIIFTTTGNKAKSVSVPVTKGRYDSPNTPIGSLKVYFEISQSMGPSKTSQRTGQPYRDVVNLVPPNYSTGISLQVDGDNPNQNFSLSD
jgi:hypothetical protein